MGTGGQPNQLVNIKNPTWAQIVQRPVPSQIPTPQPLQSHFVSLKPRYRKYWIDAITGRKFYIESGGPQERTNDVPRIGSPSSPTAQETDAPGIGGPPDHPQHDPHIEDEHSPDENDFHDWFQSLDSVSKNYMSAISRNKLPSISTIFNQQSDPIADLHRIETYLKPISNITNFHEQFPLPKNLYKKWKHGIRFWPQNKCAKRKSKPPTINESLQLDEMLKANIIYPVKKPKQYVGSFFLVDRLNKKFRPITNYKSLSKLFKVPKFELPSLYQHINKITMSEPIYYTKIDIKQAFYNIPVHPKSQFVTCFKVGENYYQYNVLPFGISIAPFVCQMFTNAITKWAKSQGITLAIGHIDDILLADNCKEKLNRITAQIINKLITAKWHINYTKSILIPTNNIEFLGANWNHTGAVRRTETATKILLKILEELTYKLDINDKQKQIIRGYMNYYMSFAGQIHNLINIYINMPRLFRPIIHELMVDLVFHDTIQIKPPRDEKHIIFADATPSVIAAIVYSEDYNYVTGRRLKCLTDIKVAEALAVIEAAESLAKYAGFFSNLYIFTDNMAVLYLLKKGSIKWDIPIAQKISLLLRVQNLKRFFNIKPQYIKSELNPADFYSRFYSFDANSMDNT